MLAADSAIDATGGFSLEIQGCRGPEALLIFEATLATDAADVMYRALDLGPAAVVGSGVPLVHATGTADLDVVVSPASEAAVRFLDRVGLESFDNDGVLTVVSAVEQASSGTNFAGAAVSEAPAAALATAQSDARVAEAVAANLLSDSDRLPLRTETIRQAAIDALGELDIFEFSVLERARARVQVNEPSPNPFENVGPELSVRLLTARFGGEVLASGSQDAIVAFDIVLDPGTYFIEVKERDDNEVGPYEVLLQLETRTSAVQIFPDQPFSAALGVLGDFDVYRFAVSAPSRVILQINEPNPRPDENIGPELCVEIRRDLLDASSLVVRNCNSALVRFDLDVDAGEYFVTVNEPEGNETGPYAGILQVFR